MPFVSEEGIGGDLLSFNSTRLDDEDPLTTYKWNITLTKKRQKNIQQQNILSLGLLLNPLRLLPVPGENTIEENILFFN